MLPTLDQLLNFFRNHPLPTDINPGFQNATVGGLMTCGMADLPTQRLLGYSHNPDNVLFLDPQTAFDSSHFLNVDDTLLQRVLTGTGGLAYMREERGANGARHPLGPGALDLCRSASPLSGEGASARYGVYVTNNT